MDGPPIVYIISILGIYFDDMCRILYALNQPYIKMKLLQFTLFSVHKHKFTPGIMYDLNESTHLDGYGFAQLHNINHKWILYRSVHSPQSDPNNKCIINRISNSNTNLVIGHLRNASHSDSAPVAIENTHPFYYRNCVFVHNGIIHNFPKLRGEFLRHIDSSMHSAIRGNTDSEVLFYLLLTRLHRNSELVGPAKYRTAIIECFNIVREISGNYSANIIFCDKEYSVITRFGEWENPEIAVEYLQNISPMHSEISGKIMPSISVRKIAPSLYAMNMGESHNRLLISSEPLGPNYSLMPVGAFYVVNHLTGKYIQYGLPAE